jgi:(2Fe-2S) ferredoxin
MTALVLVGMSVTDVDNRDAIAAEAQRRGGTIAFLQMGEPSLSLELTRLADAGASSITLVGIDTGPLSPGYSWLPRIAAHWWRERAGLKPTIRLARLAKSLAEIDGVLEDLVPLNTNAPGLTSEAWEDVQGHRHQVMICRGPRCTAQGQMDNVRAMLLACMEHNLGDNEVLLTHTGCQFPCNQAPVISVQPDDVWYGHVDPEAAAAIVLEHVVEGRAYEARRLPRG